MLENTIFKDLKQIIEKKKIRNFKLKKLTSNNKK